jgi:hypothetical protein
MKLATRRREAPASGAVATGALALGAAAIGACQQE